jgi:quercetin dioxygenase-like cupin family protein
MTLPAYGLGAGENLSVIRLPPAPAVGLIPAAGARLVKATSDSTGGALSLWESSFPGGLAAPLHVHHDAGEFFYVLEGQVSFFVGDGWFEAEAGAFVAIPRGAQHGFKIRSAESRMLVMFSPAAMLGMWEEIAARGWPADPEAYADLSRRYHTEELGPLPDH